MTLRNNTKIRMLINNYTDDMMLYYFMRYSICGFESTLRKFLFSNMQIHILLIVINLAVESQNGRILPKCVSLVASI
jgi:hypothetical protein